MQLNIIFLTFHMNVVLKLEFFLIHFPNSRFLLEDLLICYLFVSCPWIMNKITHAVLKNRYFYILSICYIMRHDKVHVILFKIHKQRTTSVRLNNTLVDFLAINMFMWMSGDLIKHYTSALTGLYNNMQMMEFSSIWRKLC